MSLNVCRTLSSVISGGDGKKPYVVSFESNTDVSGTGGGVGAPPHARDVISKMVRKIKIRRMCASITYYMIGEQKVATNFFIELFLYVYKITSDKHSAADDSEDHALP